LNLKIESKAAQVLLNVLLSCRCPINEDVEKKIVDYYKSKKKEQVFDFQKMITIAEESDSDTVFHRLRDFCLYSKNDLNDVNITLEDVYRHFCSIFHWKVVEDALTYSYKDIKNIPTWFVGHMLLPVTIKEQNKALCADYSFSGLKILMRNIFVPDGIKIRENGIYTIHFASVISEINPAISKMINQQLESINRFVEFRNDIVEINYANFQRFGDYGKFCRERYLKYF
jgi:hypothetical protein